MKIVLLCTVQMFKRSMSVSKQVQGAHAGANKCFDNKIGEKHALTWTFDCRAGRSSAKQILTVNKTTSAFHASKIKVKVQRLDL